MPLYCHHLCIHIGPGIFRLSLFFQNGWNHFVEHINIFEDGIVGKMFQAKLPLNSIAGVGLRSTACPKPGITCPLCNVSQTNCFISSSVGTSPPILSIRSCNQRNTSWFASPCKACQAIDHEGGGKVNIRKRAAYKMCCVGANVSTFVIGMNDEMHTCHIIIRRLFSHHMGKVSLRSKSGSQQYACCRGTVLYKYRKQSRATWPAYSGYLHTWVPIGRACWIMGFVFFWQNDSRASGQYG